MTHKRWVRNWPILKPIILLIVLILCLQITEILILLPLIIFIIDFMETDALITKRWENDSISPLLLPLPYRFPIRKKCNLNVLVVGTSGKGKTNLLDYLASKYFEKFVVFCFKENDLHLGLNAEIIDVSEYGPFDKEGFVDAFMLTFQPKIIGEIVSRYAGVLVEVVARSSDWPTLLKSLDEAIRKERDRINKTTLLSLKEKIYLLVPEGSGEIPVLDRVVYDFSKLNEYQKCFFAQLILRKIRNARDMALVIDEAYNVFKRTEYHVSVLEVLLREGRSRNLAILVATQSLLDVPEPVIPQFDTIFVFSTTGEDLRLLRSIGIPVELIQNLGNYECVDIRDGVDRFDVLRFKKFKGARSEQAYEGLELLEVPRVRYMGEDFPIDERYELELEDESGLLEDEVKDLEAERSTIQYIRRLEDLGDATNALKDSSGQYDVYGAKVHRASLDYRAEILRLLAKQGMMSTTAIAKAIAEKYGLDKSRTKFACLTYLKRLCNKGEVVRTEFRDEFNRKTVYYELPTISESQLHKLMVEKVMVLAWKLNLPVEKKDDVDVAIGGIGIEVETGRKDRKLTPRPWYREIWVVVPNEEVKEKYPGSMTLRELYLRLKEMVEGTPTRIRRDSAQTERRTWLDVEHAEMHVHDELARAAINYVKKSMVAYLDGKKGLKWMLGVIRSSGVRGGLLLKVFKELESYGDSRLWKEALEACRKRGYL
ncbi:MAG TPA: hypothetical protein EYP68_01960 [Candidatus Korarchaeota archaeon]|nr:hypothetical protein [Candidatus Korarchaeota archaeon]